MTYRDSRGRWWEGRRKNGWPNDQKAPDGFTVNGYRKVGKDGGFTLVGTRWNAKLTPGSIVYCWIHGAWALSVSAVVIDTSIWNPDTINDDWRAFVQHAHARDDSQRIHVISEECRP